MPCAGFAGVGRNKEKIRKTIHRLPKILRDMKQNEEAGKKKRIDPEEALIVEILDDVIRSEKKDWVKDLVENLKREETDIRRIEEVPVSRAKYYLLKNRLVEKIYNCCISKGYVTYEDVLGENIN